MREKGPPQLPAEEITALREFLVQLARLALTGRPQDVQAYVSRISRRLKTKDPFVAEALGTLVREAPTQNTPLRGAAVAAVPVDQESRLSLARVETVSCSTEEPIWDPLLRRQLELLIQERHQVRELNAAGLEPTKTALFVGPPGVGKTLAARWIAEALNLPLIVLDLAAVMSSFLGKTGLNVRNVLDYAKGVPCVLLLDEIDAIAKRRDDETEVGELKRLVTVLIQQLDDWSSATLLIAATNHPDLLDPALWRRFESVIKFAAPTYAHRRELIGRQLHPLGVSDELQNALALTWDGGSFSDVTQALNTMHRHSVLSRRPIEEHVYADIEDRLEALPRGERQRVAHSLLAAGLSQRKTSDLTGVARDTLRRSRSEATGGRQTTIPSR